VRPFLVAFVLIFALAVGRAAERAQQGTISPVPPLPQSEASASTPAATLKDTPKATIDGFDSIVRPFVTENCVPCHGYKKQKNGLNLESYESAASLRDDHERWAEVVKKLRGREMPPEEEPQPPEHQRQAVAGWLSKELDRIDKLTPPDPGRVTARRLNRTEYNNTVRDLLAVNSHPADDFPQDDAGYGFDNIADVLSLSPVLMEKYSSASEKVTRTALFGPPTLKPTLTRLRSDGRRVRDAKTFAGTYDVTGLSIPNAFHAMHRVPVDGEYVIKVALSGLRPAGSEPIEVALWIDDHLAQSIPFDSERSATFNDDRQDFGGQVVQFKAHLTAGDPKRLTAVATLSERIETPALQLLAREFNLPVRAISAEVLAGIATPTQSKFVQERFGAGSVAEAAALAAAGRRARLVCSRTVSKDRTATAAIAEGEGE